VISRAARQAEFPARFQLIAAMNPCPCGHLGSALRACRCTPDAVARYQGVAHQIKRPNVTQRDLEFSQLSDLTPQNGSNPPNLMISRSLDDLPSAEKGRLRSKRDHWRRWGFGGAKSPSTQANRRRLS